MRRGSLLPSGERCPAGRGKGRSSRGAFGPAAASWRRAAREAGCSDKGIPTQSARWCRSCQSHMDVRSEGGLKFWPRWHGGMIPRNPAGAADATSEALSIGSGGEDLRQAPVGRLNRKKRHHRKENLHGQFLDKNQIRTEEIIHTILTNGLPARRAFA